ncbi:TIGR04063 family PEP-CTERM/XrtA system glycosyltransferase [Methylocaldum sp.]|uniref:TIGR04063 family PEP-CTERM/XrtA system glycosyltransferase n=1 Tax=Methylocaldum sp. TaxID=1969727 RepID=UPI002D4F73A1|nr:TIGR04063 family PEP-CTERM/XrtA system glycosyltransferase [Methylocaldum sp.]HYE37944.1 TIGR04063 family PEP-CTERM/XrtA system glycosyltransferase [Methylocaldum sp.]
MRILHILDHSIPLHSGYTFRTRAILEQQRALGFETFHITSAKHKASDVLVEEVDGFRFFRTPQPIGWYARLPLLDQFAVVDGLAKRLGDVVEEVKPDILHAHSPALNGLAALRVAQWYSLPVVYECRAFWEDAAVDHGTSREGGPRYRATRALETYVFRGAHAITTICEGLRQDIIQRGIPDDKITVIPNAVDVNRFQFGGMPDQDLREELSLTGKTVLGFIGSFYAYEGLPLLLEAMPEMLQKKPELRLLLVGGGPQESHLMEIAKKLRVEDRILFVGRVPHDKVQRYYDQVDIFVYPRYSIRLTELVTPLKPLEAMAQGRLVVASDVGGHKELIKNRETGWLFKAGDVPDLAHKILDILDHPETWSAVKEAGRRFVEQQRNWAGSVGRYVNVYQPLLQGKP